MLKILLTYVVASWVIYFGINLYHYYWLNKELAKQGKTIDSTDDHGLEKWVEVINKHSHIPFDWLIQHFPIYVVTGIFLMPVYIIDVLLTYKDILTELYLE